MHGAFAASIRGPQPAAMFVAPLATCRKEALQRMISSVRTRHDDEGVFPLGAIGKGENRGFQGE